MWLVNWLINSIPPWLWVVIVGGILLATYSLWLPIWSLLPNKVKVVIIFIVTLGGAYFAGRYKGAKDERTLMDKRKTEALQKRVEVDREIQRLPPSEVDKRLDKWTRPE
jgi:hypothetical protein